MSELRTALAQYLERQGVAAVTAWSEEERKRPGKAVCAVSLRSMEGGPPGFRDYLGERFNEETGAWEELYGKKLRLTFGLDLYGGSAQAVQEGLDALTAALEGGVAAGLRVSGFSAGETKYRGEERRYVCPVQAVFEAWSYAVAQEGGAFLDFEVKGESKV